MKRPAQPSAAPLRRVLFLLAFALGAMAGSARAGDLKLEARLIWGANDSPATVNHNLADPGLSAGLRRNFKWTNYYEVTNLTAVIPLNESREVRISDHCTLKIRNLGSARVAVDCIGQSKTISKGTNTLPFIFGSNDTNNTAWFVSLQSAGARMPESGAPIGKK